MGQGKPWKQVKTDWHDVVLVCRKCAKKLDGGFGQDGDERLAQALRRFLDDGQRHRPKERRRAVAVVEVGCLDICPKKAVVVVRGSDPEACVLVPEGATMADVVERLGVRIGSGSEDDTPLSTASTGRFEGGRVET